MIALSRILISKFTVIVDRNMVKIDLIIRLVYHDGEHLVNLPFLEKVAEAYLMFMVNNGQSNRFYDKK